MKKLLSLSAFLFCLFFTSGLQAQYKSAIGLRLSSNDAVVNHSASYKHFFGESLAGEALVSFAPFAIGALLEKHKPLKVEGLQWLYGAGAFVAFEGRRNAGTMGILGLDYRFPALPLNLSLDWKPELSLVREFSFEPAAVGLSVRFVLQ